MVPRPLLTVAILAGLASAALAQAQAPTESAPQLIGDRDLHALSGTLRALLVQHAPAVLHEASPGWGQTKRVAHGVKWTGKLLPLRPELTYADKPDGNWRKIQVSAVDLPNTLVFDLRNLHNPEPGRMTFDIFLSFDARIDYEHQKWDAGTRIYSGSVRARLRFKLLLQCEAITRLEPNGSLLPDAVFRLRVTRSDLHYDNLVVEHAAGVGGEAARLLGDAVEGSLREWHPSLERELFTRANAAIVKAGDTQEVRLSLSNLFSNQDPLSAAGLKLLPGQKPK
jgi:hypothetical protein